MARKIIDTGTLGNPATGDSLRTAMTKINTNFEELYLGNAADGQITTSVTNGDISIQPNGTGVVEVDALSVNSDNITSLTTNSSVTITGNGTAGVDIEGISVNGTTISSSDSSTININENLIVDGTGDFTGGATIDGVSITDNTITTGSSNSNLQLSASGSGLIEALSNLLLKGATPFLQLQRTDNANVPGLDFIGSGGTSGAKILFDGTSGTSNELIFQTFDGSSLTESFRVQRDGAKVSGTLDVDGGISITDNTITSSASNADLELNASGSGTIVLENLKVGTGATVTTILDEDNMSSNSATALATQQSIKAYVDSESGTGDFTFVGSTMSTPSNADVDITPGGTGNVNLNGDTVRLGDNDADATITTQGTGDLTLSTNGGTNSGTILLRDGTNGDIILEPDGTGDVLLKGNRTGIGTVNQPDTLLHLKDTNAVITLQRTNDANTPGISFQQSGGNVRGVIKLDGTSGTSNEIFMQTYDGSTLAERFRVTHTGAKVSGTLEMSDGLSIDGSIITSPSNADIVLTAGGTGSVDIEGIQIKGTEISSSDSTQVTIKENLHVTGNITGTINANQLSGALPAISGSNLTGVAKFAFRTVLIGGGNSLVADDAVDTLTIHPGNNVTITDDDSLDSFTINVNGMGDLTFVGSTIISPSNADITLDPAGTGQVVANAAVKFNAGYVEKINTLTSSSTITVDCSAASIHKVTLATNTEFNISNLPTGGTVTLIITQDGSGSRTATFGTDGSTAVKFPGGSPTLSTGAADIDVVTIVNDGTNFLGNCAKNYS